MLVKVAAQVFERLGPALKAANAMDFDDLLLHPVKLFHEHPDRLEYWRHKFDHLLVDEFQDTNTAPVPPHPLPGAGARQRDGGRRRRPVHLWMARGPGREHEGVPAGLPRDAGDAARAQLPLHPGGPRRRQPGHRAEQGKDREDAAHHPGRGGDDHPPRRRRRTGRGGVGRARAAGAPERLGLRVDGGPLPHQFAEPRLRGAVPPRGGAVPAHRRDLLLRPARGEGPPGLPPPGGEPEG